MLRGLIQLFNWFIAKYNILMSSKVSRNNSPPKATSSPPKGQSPPKNESKAQSPPKNQQPSKIAEKPQPVAVQPPKGKAPEPPKQAPKAPEPPKQKAPEPQKKQAAKVQQTPKKGAFDVKSYAKNGVTEEEVAAAKNAFDLFDSDQGGTVDIRELKAAMTSLGFESKNGAIFQMIIDLDADGNGTIDFQQWLNLLTKKVNDKDSRENINKIFALFDDERTGFISVHNLHRVAQELGENVSEAELNELIKRADVDCDGRVSEEEFYIILTRKIKD